MEQSWTLKAKIDIILSHSILSYLGNLSGTKSSKYSSFVALLLVKNPKKWSLNKVMEDILPFVLNTKPPLSDIWLLRYKQNRFGCFREKSQFQFFPKTPKIVLLITQQQNIPQRPFCIQNEWQDILYLPIYMGRNFITQHSWRDRGYPAARFEYKTASEGYLVIK